MPPPRVARHVLLDLKATNAWMREIAADLRDTSRRSTAVIAETRQLLSRLARRSPFESSPDPTVNSPSSAGE